MGFRSNKGASKQRRDQINGEISVMRDLLPLPESARQRLSQLQIMSLSCVFIRKCNVLQKSKCTVISIHADNLSDILLIIVKIQWLEVMWFEKKWIYQFQMSY